MGLEHKQKIQDFVNELNIHLNDNLFIPNRPKGEFKFIVRQEDYRTFCFLFTFEDDEEKLRLVVMSYSVSGDDFLKEFDNCCGHFYVNLFRWAYFSIDSVGKLQDALHGNPINNLTINTLFKEGLKQLKTNKTT